MVFGSLARDPNMLRSDTMTRIERQQRKKRSKLQKLLIGTLFFILVFGGSMHISFAAQDIGSILMNWFDEKTAESITTMEEAIATEQHKQTERLKEELRLEIASVNSQLLEFTNAEKAKRIKELEQYADNLIQNLEIDTIDKQSEILTELNEIVAIAKEHMNEVTSLEATEKEVE